MSRAIVPYVPRAVSGYPIRFNRQRINRYAVAGWLARKTALRVGSYAARKIQTRYRRYRSSRAMRINRRIQGSRESTKKHGVNSFQPGLIQRTLYFRQIDMTEQDSTDVNTRLTSNIRLRGFRICDEFANNLGYPIELHYTIIQLKENVGGSADVTGPLLARDFFRNPTSTSEKSTDFVNHFNGAGWDINYKCLNLNPDKFNIITHKRKIMDSMTPNGGTINTSDNQIQSTRERSWFWKCHKWYPIKKRHSFDKTTDRIPQRPYIVMYWWTALRRSDHNTSFPGDGGGGGVTRESQDVVYFKNGT